MRTRALLALFFLNIGIASLAFAKGDESQVIFDYAGDVRFAWQEPLDRPGAAASSRNTVIPADAEEAYRSLGLRAASFEFLIQHFHQSFFGGRLRPDFFQKTPGDPVKRDFDSRAGEVYRPKPQVFLLDAYQVGTLLGDQVSISYGVWDQFYKANFAFEDINEFGLTVQMPEKFAAFRLNFKTEVAAIGSSLASQIDVSAYVLQGREERVENLAKNDRVFDTSSASLNPYWGGALVVHWLAEEYFDLSLVGGWEQRRENGQKVQEQYGNFVVLKKFPIFSQAVNLGLDARVSAEKRNINQQTVRLNQQSIGILGDVPILDKFNTVFGLYYGTSDRFNGIDPSSSPIKFKGYQTDLGVVKEISKNLRLSLILTREFRMVDDDSERGGFIANSQKKRINRFGFDLRYIF